MNTRAHTGEREDFPQGRLWFGFAAAAVAWVAHETLSVVLNHLACQGGAYTWAWPTEAGFRVLLAVITLALLALALVGGVTSFRNWRRLAERRELIRAEGRGREEFMALLGVFVSTVFTVGIVWAGLPLVMLDVCGSAR